MLPECDVVTWPVELEELIDNTFELHITRDKGEPYLFKISFRFRPSSMIQIIEEYTLGEAISCALRSVRVDSILREGIK